MALPTELLRQRTRADLLRQRQEQLRQRIEQPQPTQQVTTAEQQEYEKLRQQYEKQQAELQGAISRVDDQISRKAVDLQSIKNKIQEIQARGGSTPSGLRATANNLSEEISRLNAQKSILKDSYSVAEARVRQSVYGGQRAEELSRQQQARMPIQPISTATPTTARKPESRYLQEKVIGTFKGTGGRETPLTKIYVTDERGSILREANRQEIEDYRKGTREYVASEEKPSLFYKAKEKIPKELKMGYEKVVGAIEYVDVFGSEKFKEKVAIPLRKSVTSDILALGTWTPAVPAVALKPQAELYFKAPLRQPKTTFIELQQPAVIKGKPTILSSYKITREVSPPLRYEPLSLDIKVKSFVKPAKIETTKTITPAIDQNIFFVSTTKPTGKIELIQSVRGVSREIPTTTAEFNKLSATQKYLWKKYIEDLTGRPVSYENVPKILSEKKAQLGYIETYKVAEVRPKEITLLPEVFTGKGTAKAEAFSIFKKTAETPQAEVFKGTTFFKDVTYPYARPIGKTPKMTGKVIRIKEPIMIGEDKGVTMFKSVGAKRTPLSQTFAQQELKLTPKPVPKPPKVKPSSVISEKIAPEILSVKPVSAYAGLGLYERTIGGLVPKAKEVSLLSPLALQTEKLKELSFFKPIEKEKQIEISRTALKQQQKPVQLFKQTQILKQKPIPISKTTGTRAGKIKTTIAKVPKIPKITLTLPKKTAQKVRKALAELKGEGVDVQVGMEEGKKKIIYKNLPPKLAYKKAQQFVDNTTYASFRLLKSGKKPKQKDISSLQLSGKFKPSKRKKLYMIEKKSARIDTIGEKRGLKTAKQKKKIRWFK